ncbi:MAG TPA: TonB-dependent receptor plug domain-containing protein, partial [Bacteroidia bacterium]
MRSFTVLFLFFLLNIAVFSQNNISFRLLDSLTKENIPSAGVKFEGTKVFVLTDTSGNATAKNIPDGNYSVQFTSVGYRTKTILISLPKDTLRKKIKVLLGPDQVMMDEVVISSTRTHSHMGDSPLKVEVIGEDETEEENGIKPGNVSSLLGDVSGIQIQQTSPVSGNSNVRMLGLQGKYTQVLRDGIPMYEGFSADFGVMQLPPLDLKQIEIVKGSASTLYGGG